MIDLYVFFIGFIVFLVIRLLNDDDLFVCVLHLPRHAIKSGELLHFGITFSDTVIYILGA